MKKITTFILTIISIISMLLFSNLNVYRTSLPEIMQIFNTSVYISELTKLTRLEPIYEFVPKQYHNQLDEITNKIQSDPKVTSLIETQINDTLDDIIHDQVSFNEQSLLVEINDIIDDYDDEIQAATNSQINSDVMKQQMQVRLKGYNLSTIYENTIRQVNRKLSPNQIKLLKLFSIINENMNLIIKVSFLTSILSLAFLSFINLRALRIIFLASSLIQLLNAFLFDFLIDLMSKQIGLPFNEIVFNQNIYYKTAMALFVGFVISTTLYSIKKQDL